MSNIETNLISQGSYGCIFQPGFTCKGKSINNKKYITKVQKRADTSKKETKLGKKIIKIDSYEDYFAPILKTCEISLARMEKDSVKRCDFIKESNDKKYESNKLRYVGKHTLSKYILDVVDYKPTALVRVLVNTHKHLLVGFKKLFSEGIVHLDVKENNVMMEDNNGTPIIIDFGLSCEVKKISDNKYRDAFFVYGPDYAPWCIDICMMTYMANELEQEIIPPGMLGFVGFEEKKTKNWMEGMVTKEKLTKVINDFIKKNPAMTELFNKEQKTEYSKTLHEYFNSFVGKTWNELAEALIANVSSWDCYAVSVVYLHLLQDLELRNVDKRISSWDSYKKILEDMILSKPDERMNCNDMIKKLDILFSNISRSENTKMRKLLDNVLVKNKNIHTNVLNSVRNNLHRETKVYQALQ
jgi:serine/threonine protein kinase